jgi:hypothetical protein
VQVKFTSFEGRQQWSCELFDPILGCVFRVCHPVHVFKKSLLSDKQTLIFSRGRKMTDVEMFRLQGFPDKRLKRPRNVTKRDIRLMIGNSFTVTIFVRVLSKLLHCMGYNPEVYDGAASPIFKFWKCFEGLGAEIFDFAEDKPR